MDALKKSLFAIIAISLFLPTLQAEDKIYRVEGLPSDLHYSTGTSYEIRVTANDYASISEVNISVTNGSLSSTDAFEVDVHNLILESSEDGISFINNNQRYGQLIAGDTLSNITNPFLIEIDSYI